MLNIAVNTRLLREGRLEGIGWFTWEVFRRLAAAHPEVQFHFIYDEKPAPSMVPTLENVKTHKLFPPARRRLLYRWWFDRSMPRMLKKINADLFISPDGFASLKTKVPQLVVIHDLNFEHYPELLPPKVAEFYQTYFPRFAAVAKRIATVSEYSKRDIARNYAVPAHRIDVVYNGVNEVFRPLMPDEVNAVRAEQTEANPYFVYVGSLNPRKNLVRLLRAFDIFKTDTGAPHHLLIIGQPMWKGSEVEEVYKAMQHRNAVHMVGRAEPEEMALLVGAAEAMVFVPLFEGFGIPVIESFASGVPLIASNTTSIPEVAGDAALLVDPKSISEMVGAMKRIKSDPELRQELIEKGLEQVRKYSWDLTAERMWDSIQAALEP